MIDLPKEISFTKEQTLRGMAFVFRHEELGELGRIVLQGMGEESHISCEIAGDPRDPMTKKREEIFEGDR